MKTFLNKRETEITKHLYTITKDSNDYIQEVNEEMDLSKEESEDFKIKFLTLLSKSLNISFADETRLIENNYQEIVKQNQSLQFALIESDKLLDKVQNIFEEYCNEGIVTQDERRMQELIDEIKRVREN